MEWVGFVARKGNKFNLFQHYEEDEAETNGWLRFSRNSTKQRAILLLKDFRNRVDMNLPISFNGKSTKRRIHHHRKGD